MRIVFSLLHPGYVRNYESTLALLAERGHELQLMFSQPRKQAEDRVAERLASRYPTITFDAAPRRTPKDPWRSAAWLSRALADLARYLHPRYAGAPLLRARVEWKIRKHLQSTDPLSSLLTRVVLRVFRWTSGERWSNAFVALFNGLESVIPASRRIERHLEGLRPDLVLVTPAVNLFSNEVEIVKSAQRLRLPTGICVASWDNLTNKGLLRPVPDRVFVWNDIQRREAVELHAIPRERVVLTGAQRFDEWFEQRPATTYGDFASRVGLDPNVPFLLYLCSSPFIAPDEVSFVRRWLADLRSHPFEPLATSGVLIRPHPQNAQQWLEADLSDFENVTIWPRAGAQPVDEGTRAEFFDSIYHSTAVIGVNTSALIEAAILDKSVYTLLAPEFEKTQRGTLHFSYLLRENGGFLSIASEMDEHLDDLAHEVAVRNAARDKHRAFVQSFVRPHGLDVAATPILADAIEELGRSEVVTSAAPPAWARLLRAAMLPLALLTLALKLGTPGTARHVGRLLVRRAYAVRARIRRAFVRVARALFHRTLRALSWSPRSQRLLRALAANVGERVPGLHEHAGGIALGGDSDVLNVDQAVKRLPRGHGEWIYVAPWPGEVRDEILYWIPFVRWAAERRGITRERIVVAGRTGAGGWYEDICTEYIEADARDAAAALLERRNGRSKAAHSVLTPEPLLGLLRRYRDGTLPMRELQKRLRHAPLGAGRDDPRLPDAREYVAVARTFSQPLPDTPAVRAWRDELERELAPRIGVVWTDSPEADGEEAGTRSGEALSAASAIASNARAVVASDVTLACVAIAHRTPTVLVYSRRAGLREADIEAASRMARALDVSLAVVPVSELALVARLAAAGSAATRHRAPAAEALPS